MTDPAAHPDVQALIHRALEEDVGTGDVSARATISPEEQGWAVMVSRGDYVISGLTVAELVFASLDDTISCKRLAQDGDTVVANQTVMDISGPAASILTAERTALNLVQRMTGIATMTREFVRRSEGTQAMILDTRKTTPNLRRLEKYAVVCGGGVNHRMGLYDKIMLKDNHLALWRRHHEGSLADMVHAARQNCPGVDIEVEVENQEDLAQVLGADPDWVLLDNMTPAQLRACVELNQGRSKLEASGGVTLETIADVAATGVDAVSVGALTHSVEAADLALEMDF